MQETPEESRQFEQVLSRLDALMKRSQTAGGGATSMPEAPSSSSAATQHPDTIPLLTEVYEGDTSSLAPDDGLADAVVEALLPELHAVVARVLDEETEKLRLALRERLHAETVVALRQRLLQLK